MRELPALPPPRRVRTSLVVQKLPNGRLHLQFLVSELVGYAVVVQHWSHGCPIKSRSTRNLRISLAATECPRTEKCHIST